MTILDLAESCHPRLSHNEAKRIAFDKVSRLRACDWRVAELEPCELAKLRPLFQAASEAKAKGPELPGLEAGALPQVYLFDKWRVRVALLDEKPWFVAKDVAEALGYTWSGTSRIEHVPAKWRGVTSVVTPSGNQDMAILSLEGLFHFLNRSDKPAAQPFQEWVNGEVLVLIHETGAYSPKPPVQPAKARQALSAAIVREYRLAAKDKLMSPADFQLLIGLPALRAPKAIEDREPGLSPAEAEARFKELRDKVGAK